MVTYAGMFACMQPEACFRTAETPARKQPRSTAEPPGGTDPEPTRKRAEAQRGSAQEPPPQPTRKQTRMRAC